MPCQSHKLNFIPFFPFIHLLICSQLHVASANGYSKVVEFLLENHAAVDAVDKDLWTPAHAAACWGHVCIFSCVFHYTHTHTFYIF